MFGFQNLEIYQLSKEIIRENYLYTDVFPEKERFSLAQQMNRAAISIASNIAEGTSRKSPKDKSHFINMAYSSLMELVCRMEIASELGYIEKFKYEEFSRSAKNLAVKLHNFINSINSRI